MVNIYYTKLEKKHLTYRAVSPIIKIGPGASEADLSQPTNGPPQEPVVPGPPWRIYQWRARL